MKKQTSSVLWAGVLCIAFVAAVFSLESVYALEDKGPTLTVAPLSKSHYDFGEEIVVRMVFRNTFDTDLEINDPSPIYGYTSKIKITDVNGKNVPGIKRRMIRPAKIIMPPGGIYEVNSSLISSVFTMFLKAGDYRLTIIFRGVEQDTLAFTITPPSPKTEKKYQMWMAALSVGERAGNITVCENYFKEFPFDNDPITINMAGLYAENLSRRNRSAEAILFLSNKIKHAPKLRESLAEIYHDIGNIPEAIETIKYVDAEKAVDWIEDLVQEGRGSKHGAEMVHEKVLSVTPYVSNDRLANRLLATQATAYYIMGDLEKAIELIRPIVPEEAEKWEKEVDQKK